MTTADFTEHRGLLFSVAYGMLGSVADAEDVVQETWLRWSADDRSDVRDPRAYLVRIATRQALNRLRTVSRQRETYVGPWLPEPLVTRGDVADDVELADSVSFAMLVVLDRLGPVERAVFLLREVFAYPYADIALATERTEAAVRQIAHRARAKVAAAPPDVSAHDPRREEVGRAFLDAAATGDVQALLRVLAPDVVLFTDGGGVVRAGLRPIVGVEKVLRFLTGVIAQYEDVRSEPVLVNHETGLLVYLDGVLDQVATFGVKDGRIVEMYLVRNPEKLTRVPRGPG